MDLDGDGKLSKDEIRQGYGEHFGRAMAEDEVDELFDRIDVDGTGAIEYSEFVVASMHEKSLLTDEKLMSAFKTFDKDGSG